MTSSRASILGTIKSGLDAAGAPDRVGKEGARNRIAGKPRGLMPEKLSRDANGLVELFVEQAKKVSATVARLTAEDDVPAAIADYLARENLPASLKIAQHKDLQILPWDKVPAVTVTEGIGTEADVVGFSRAVRGVAETGTLMMRSGPESPATLNFLPETHIVLIRASEIDAGYEDGWDQIKKAGLLPRLVNMITGPSRTGDIEQTIYLGAHGPRRLHIVLIDDL